MRSVVIRDMDIVFATGFNNSREGMSISKLKEKTFEMQKAYHKKFPNARLHLTSYIPFGDRQLEANEMLNVLSQDTGCQFISTKAFRDSNTGDLRPNLTKGIHLKEIGLKTYTKAIMKSLFSPENIGNPTMATIVRLSDNAE